MLFTNIHTAVLVQLINTVRDSEAAKVRPWLGPDVFTSGQVSSARAAHGFASANDGKLYVFGGRGNNG